MNEIKEMTIEEFTKALSSSAPVPGGGGASALVGAIGLALGNMVGALTLGKKKYAEVEADIRGLIEKAESLQLRLLDEMDEDAAAFSPLAKAYSIPKETPGRDEIMEAALQEACKVPLEIMKSVGQAIELIGEFAEKGTVVAISDAGVGALCCKAALQGASLNVFINTKAMKNRFLAAELEEEAYKLLSKYCPLAEEIYELVKGKL